MRKRKKTLPWPSPTRKALFSFFFFFFSSSLYLKKVKIRQTFPTFYLFPPFFFNNTRIYKWNTQTHGLFYVWPEHHCSASLDYNIPCIYSLALSNWIIGGWKYSRGLFNNVHWEKDQWSDRAIVRARVLAYFVYIHFYV